MVGWFVCLERCFGLEMIAWIADGEKTWTTGGQRRFLYLQSAYVSACSFHVNKTEVQPRCEDPNTDNERALFVQTVLWRRIEQS